jgi:phosphoribosyl 1,2-cyclic phosphodiesterase
MRVVSLGSGSSGNAYFVEAGPQGRTKLLLDAGLSARTLIARLASIGVSLSDIQSVLITHEHSDHVQSIPTLVNRYLLPVMADPRTLTAIQEGLKTGVWRSDSGRVVPTKELALPIPVPNELSLAATTVQIALVDTEPLRASIDDQISQRPSLLAAIDLPAGSQRTIGDIAVTSFPVSHDAIAPCGYLLEAGGCRVCLVTDAGEVTITMLNHIQYADLLILESNHDRERLRRGPYPWMLKQRILSPTGHLSNDQAAEAVLRIWRERDRRWLWLAHISRTNNTPMLALESMRTYLRSYNANLSYITISVLPPTMGPTWDSRQLWH